MQPPARPWAFVPTVYFAEGLPYILINTVSVALYTDLGLPVDRVAFWTGWLYLPWILKMFWSPLVDGKATKRRWLTACQAGLSVVFLAVAAACIWEGLHPALSAGKPGFFAFTLCALLAGAFVSATHDIAADGYYLLALTPKAQSAFVGIRTIFYRLAMIFGSGILISAAGTLAACWPHPYNWAAVFIFITFLFAAFFMYHARILPRPEQDQPQAGSERKAFKQAFASYFTQKNIGYILIFILLYRVGDALLEKTVVPFLLRPEAEGALDLSLQSYGLIKGTLGLGAVIAGNLAGGWLLARYGFKKCIWPFAAVLILPNFFYAYMAYARPGILAVGALVTLEHLGNGLAMMAFMVFIMYVSQGRYKTSHYAISTGVMALGMMVPSMLSGALQTRLGYPLFFTLTACFSLITLAIVPLTFKIKSLEETERHFRQHTPSLEDAE